MTLKIIKFRFLPLQNLHHTPFEVANSRNYRPFTVGTVTRPKRVNIPVTAPKESRDIEEVEGRTHKLVNFWDNFFIILVGTLKDC